MEDVRPPAIKGSTALFEKQPLQMQEPSALRPHQRPQQFIQIPKPNMDVPMENPRVVAQV